MDMTPDRWLRTRAYLDQLLEAPDEQRRTLMPRAAAAGIPQIAVAPDTGRALRLLASMTNDGRGARVALELGTLAGYSALWIVDGLHASGRLITVEPNEKHAGFAQAEFQRAGVAGRVEIRRSTGLEVLAALDAELGPGSVDFVFLDAIKTEYPEYFEHARRLLAPRGIVAFDNALGSNDWWIDAPPGTSAERDAVDRLMRTVVADEEFTTTCFTNNNGLLVARRRNT